MSPAPYPPLHAGDDVDADFFDQLGDELDFGVPEDGSQKYQDDGDKSLPDASGKSEFVSPVPSSLVSSQKSHPDGLEQRASQQEGNSYVDFELDDALSELSLAKPDAESVSFSNTASEHALSNGGSHGVESGAEVVLVSALRVIDEGIENFPTEDSSIVETTTSARLSGGGHHGDGLEVERMDLHQTSGDPQTPISTSSEIPSQDNVLRESSFSGQQGSYLLSEESAESLTKGSLESTSDEGPSRSTELSKSQKQTTDVTEVQWSDFGASGGFGSFSDLLSVYPADAPQRDIQVPGWSVGHDFFQLTADSVSDVGFHVSEQQFGNAPLFHVQQDSSEMQSLQKQMPSQFTTSGHEPQISLQSSGEEYRTYEQSQGQAPQMQSDQGEWQNLYEGWLYNTLTGEWRELSPNSAEGAGSVGNYSAGQQQNQEQVQENQNYVWHDHELSGGATQANAQSVFSNGDVLEGPTGAGGFQNGSLQTDTENRIEQTNLTHNPLFETTLTSNESLGEVVADNQQTWENQYPGWYYDHQAQEWKEYNQAPQIGVLDPSLSSQGPQESPTLPAGLDQQGSYVDSYSQGYNATSWSVSQDRQYVSGTQYIQDNHSSLGASTTPSQFDTSSALPTQMTASHRTGEVGAAHWTRGNSDHPLGYPSSYYAVEKSPASEPTQQYMQQIPYSAHHGDPQATQRMPEFHYEQYETPQVSAYNSQVPLRQASESQYHYYGTPEAASNTAQSWSTPNSYQAPHYSQYASLPQYATLTPPKSTSEALRTSVGRPAHVLMAFGFGGKLLVMKPRDPISLQAIDGHQSISSGQAWVPGPIHVYSLSQLVTQSIDHGSRETGRLYFSALSRPSFTGPLIGGSVSNKELSKWLEDRGLNCQSEEPDSSNPASLSTLWGLLKVACQHYGKLRSAIGTTGITSQEEGGPEAALSKLLTSKGNQGSWTMGSFATNVCLQSVPSEHQLQATASEVKKLLVAGKRKEALTQALHGQLWGPALVLARQLGDKFYSDAVAQMALYQFLPGSPLRTLSLLLAGQPAEVFSGNLTQVPTSLGASTQDGLGSMLEDWQENLSIMATNRTNGDDRVISHLGDCLWKVKGEVAAAHICYLVADADFEAFTSNARLCLIGADHWKNPRTFATPEAIQRTEVYEYSKVLGNPQFTLVHFQPYKLIYASMLAEAGKTTEALRYCQAVTKTLKTASRAPEVETCRQAAKALEERLSYHTQGGHAGNLAPGKLVRTIIGVLDRGIHGIIGGPPQAPDQLYTNSKTETLSTPQEHLTFGNTGYSSSLPPAPMVPSASAQKLNEVSQYTPIPRSVSEPDFSTNKESKEKGKAIQGRGATGGYLGRLSSTLFQKAGGIVGFVSKSGNKEAKLGQKNKFYYDEKLKRWVEEGASPSEDEIAPPPPPTSVKFLTKVEEAPPDTQFGGASGPRASLGTPPVPPSNQFSARTKHQGVRSRYVDTFNKGGSAPPSKPVSTVLLPSARTVGTPLQPMNFFVPGPSLDSSNGPVLNSENETSVTSSEEYQTGHFVDPASSMEEHMNMHQNSAIQQNSHHKGGMKNPSMQGVSSAENTNAPGALEGSDELGRNSNNARMGFANGYHSRANSWSGYPSDYQTSQYAVEPNSSHDNSAPSFSLYNGFSRQASMTSIPSVGSYFPSPPKVDIFKPSPSDAVNEGSLPLPPSVEPFTTTMIGGSRPGVLDGRSANQAPVSLVGDDLQEVEL